MFGDRGGKSFADRPIGENFRFEMKNVLKILLLAAILSATMVSCRSSYYFPGGNPKNRRAPKDCGCPSYVLRLPGPDSSGFKYVDLQKEMQSDHFVASRFLCEDEGGNPL